MLNPEGSAQPPVTDGVVGQGRSRNSAARPPLNIDPSWRAGRKLEEARRQLGLSYEQVTSRIRVRHEYLEALEAMNIKLLPGKAYALAYLRSYARLLGLDEQAIVQQFQDECALSREDAQEQIRSPESRPGRERPWIFAVLLFALAGGFVGWRALGERPVPAASSDSEVAAPSSAAAGSETVIVNRAVEFRAITESWLEVRGPDGTVFLARMMRAGESYRPDPSPGWTVHARDGGQFEVTIDGQPAGLLGMVGTPVLGRQIDDIQPLPVAALPAPRRAIAATDPRNAAAPPQPVRAASASAAPLVVTTPAPAASAPADTTQPAR